MRTNTIRNATITPDEMAKWEKAHGRPPRILFLVESSNGFGHFNIVNQISAEARKFGTEVAVASGTLARRNAPTGSIINGIKCYNLPPVVSQWSKETGSISVNPDNGRPYSEDTEHQEKRAEAIPPFSCNTMQFLRRIITTHAVLSCALPVR